MRILFPIIIYNKIDANPFVNVLYEGLKHYGHHVVCSLDEFWNPDLNYDLIFFQWPDVFFPKGKEDRPVIDIMSRIDMIKHKGIPMVMTIHNMHPHNNNSEKVKLYNYLFDNLDAFHHMGSYSYDLLKEKYPNAYHFIVPHPCYFDYSEVALTVDECKKKYKLPHKPIVMAFGDFRNRDENELILNQSRCFYFKACFWAPKMNRSSGSRWPKLAKKVSRFWSIINGVKLFNGEINDNALKEMVKASDIVFIQRKEILNSGNLPLAFSFGKIVVGPNKGNVGRILYETGNPIFDPYDNKSITIALEEAFMMLKKGNMQGQKNLEFARRNWSKSYVAELLNKEISFITL